VFRRPAEEARISREHAPADHDALPVMKPTLALGLALALLSGCVGRGERSRPQRPNIVIYLIDALRADRLGSYGYHRPTSPRIDALAASSVVFEQASAAAPWTLPSVTSLLLSQFPCEHGVVIDNDRVRDGEHPLAVTLRRNGYQTASLFGNPYVGRMSGLDRGYDRSELVEQAVGAEKVQSLLSSLRPTGSAQKPPFFLYIHNVEPHNPDSVPDRYVRKFGDVSPEIRKEIARSSREYRALTRVDYVDDRPLGTTDNTAEQTRVMQGLARMKAAVDVLYDASVRQADERLGGVIHKLRRAGLWDDTLFILLADHGEELGDRGGWQHDQSLYQELIHVPLIVHFPSNRFAGRRVKEPVSLIDVAPTLLDYLGLPRSGQYRGRSLLPLCEHGSESGSIRMTAFRRNLKKYYRPYQQTRGETNVAVRWGMWKGIWNADIGSFELYDLDRDPGEKMDLSAREAERSAAMRKVARSELARCYQRAAEGPRDAGGALEEETLRRLELLGYVHRSKKR
jgi:arylsulfatase A-like enzyme